MRQATFQQREIIRDFNQAALTYDESAILQRETAERLIERLAMTHVTPQTILDLGAGTGYLSSLIKAHFSQAQLIAVDVAPQMLHITKQKNGDLSCVCADAYSLPFANASIDLIVSNMLLHWLPLDKTLYQEFHRVLRPNGLLLFSTLGPDTLCELRQSWQCVDNDEHVHDFVDMHHIGDVLVQTQFSDPVMECDPLIIHYPTVGALLNDLQYLGTSNKHPNRRRSLTGKTKFQQMLKQYELSRNADGLIPATYEVIYGIAWRQDDVQIPLTSIKMPHHQR